MDAAPPSGLPDLAFHHPARRRPHGARALPRPSAFRLGGALRRALRSGHHPRRLRRHADRGVRADGAALLRQGAAPGRSCRLSFRGRAGRPLHVEDQEPMGAWIEMIPVEQATGKLREMYDRVKTPHGTVDNVMKAHSLRPHTMEGHLVLYKSVLHNPDNTLPFWFLEMVASYVSMTNGCA